MPEHHLAPLTALGQAEPLRITLGPVTIAEVTTTALASLATRRGHEETMAGLAQDLGLPLPPPGHHETGPIWSAFWLGPDHWMAEAPVATHDDIAAALRTTFGAAASITEQTDAWVRFDLTGADLPAMLERLCILDTGRMQPGDASRTVIEHLGCYVIRHSDRFTILGPRSSAASLLHALTTAATSAY